MKGIFEAHHKKNGIYSSAIFSNCRRYRYALTRSENLSEKFLLFILLNPSTANEVNNDPTVARCQKRASILGYKSFRVCNLFAFRSKNPSLMKKSSSPIGPYNDKILQDSLKRAKQVICAWGSNGSHLERAEAVKKMLAKSQPKIFHLGLTKTNQPKHPLYLEYSQAPIEWSKK